MTPPNSPTARLRALVDDGSERIDGEIADDLRAVLDDLDRAAAREGVLVGALRRIAGAPCQLEGIAKCPGCIGCIAREALANPSPAAEALLRERDRLAVRVGELEALDELARKVGR